MFAGVKHVGVMTAAFLLLLRFTGQGPCEPPPYFRAGVNLSLDYAVLGGSLSGDAYAMSPYPPPGPYAGLGYSPYPASYFSTPPYLNLVRLGDGGGDTEIRNDRQPPEIRDDLKQKFESLTSNIALLGR